MLHFASDKLIDSDPKSLVTLVPNAIIDLPFDTIPTSVNGKLISITGGFSARQQSMAFKVAQALQRPLFALDYERLAHSSTAIDDLKDMLLFIILSKGILYWQNGLQQLKANPSWRAVISRWLAMEDSLMIAGEPHFVEPPESLLKTPQQTIPLNVPNTSQKELIWQLLGNQILGVTQIDYQELNSRYTLDYTRVKEALLKTHQGVQNQTPGTAEVTESYKSTSPYSLAGVANRTKNNFSFEEMILTKKVESDINAIIKGYKERVNLSPEASSGVIAIFQGAVGTGKSMAAECIGNELGLPLYKVDYSTLLSKSESDQNLLDQFFDQAERTSACLVFDDAETLLAKRNSKLNPAQNQFTSAIISHIEQYNGLIILTTSQKGKIDKGVFQRSLMVVDFPPMSASQQLSLFQHILQGKGVKVSNKVNLKELMSVLGANGQQIKNIIDNAILSAKPEKVPIEDLVLAAEDLARAVNQEAKKQ